MASLAPARTRMGESGVVWGVILSAEMAQSDTDTIKAVLDGNVDRYAELVDKYQQQALKVAFSLLGNYEDARDVSQEAFISAYRSLGRFRSRAKFSTWLYRILINECKDFYRRRARRPLVVARLEASDPEADGTCLFVEVDDPAADPREQVANRELGRQLSSAIEALPMKQRTAFVLRHLHGLPLEEVAEAMRCRLGTVKSHVFRASQQLRARLSPWLRKETG
jgi:RNA polymerase sigma-70 factor (ECF subfamily)